MAAPDSARLVGLDESVHSVTDDANRGLDSLQAHEHDLIGGLQRQTLLALIFILVGAVVGSLSIWYRDRRVAHFRTREAASRRATDQVTQRIRSILSSAPNPILLADSEGRILHANAACAGVLGWKPDALVGKSPDVLLDGGSDAWQNLRASELAVSDAASEDDARSPREFVEMQARHREGGAFDAEWTITRIDAPESHQFVITMQDIGLRKRAEERLILAQKDQVLGTLVAGVAHDFNNLLTAIQGGIEAAQAQPQNAAHWLHRSKTESERAGLLVRQLLQFSRHDPPERTRVSLNELVREVVEIARETFDRRIMIELNEAPSDSFIDGDPNQLRQVVMNLIVNARGTLTERLNRSANQEYVPLIQVRIARGGDAATLLTSPSRIALSVQDNGEGMSPETRERVFDPYFTTKPVDRGTGLGLSTAFGILTEHGGSIEIDSTVGRGTVVRIQLPASSTKQLDLPVVAPAPGDATADRSGSILVVDDEPAVREVVKMALSHAGYHVIAVADGRAALENVQRRSFDLVMLDVNMPSPDGWETLQRLKGLSPQLCVLMASGYALEEEARSAGACGFIDKPYSFETLVGSVDRIIAGG